MKQGTQTSLTPLFRGHGFFREQNDQTYLKLRSKIDMVLIYRLMHRMLGFVDESQPSGPFKSVAVLRLCVISAGKVRHINGLVLLQFHRCGVNLVPYGI